MTVAVEPRCLSLLRELIEIPSENPPGDEQAVAAHLADLLREAGLETRIVAADPRRPNLIARAYGGPGGPRLIFQGHLDTKPAYGAAVNAAWKTDPYRAVEIDGDVHGLGAADTKGGVAAQLVALLDFLHGPASWRGEVVWQGVADEENGSLLGAAHLLEHGLLCADGAIVAEPTNLTITTAQLGNAWARVQIHGRAAHAGTPARGVDAFRIMLSLVARLDADLAKRARDPRFHGHPRLNVGSVVCGSHPGTIPGDATMLIDVRVLPGESRDHVHQLLRDAAAACTPSGARIDVELHAGGGCESHEVNPSEWIVRALSAAWQQATEQAPVLTGFYGGTDARYFARAGTPAIVFGPGNLEQAHAPDEYVRAADVVTATRVQTALLDRFFAPG
ncbi:MAG: ArgE/DapE family deacylase [Polyangiaceae bacterium]